MSNSRLDIMHPKNEPRSRGLALEPLGLPAVHGQRHLASKCVYVRCRLPTVSLGTERAREAVQQPG